MIHLEDRFVTFLVIYCDFIDYWLRRWGIGILHKKSELRFLSLPFELSVNDQTDSDKWWIATGTTIFFGAFLLTPCIIFSVLKKLLVGVYLVLTKMQLERSSVDQQGVCCDTIFTSLYTPVGSGCSENSSMWSSDYRMRATKRFCTFPSKVRPCLAYFCRVLFSSLNQWEINEMT